MIIPISRASFDKGENLGSIVYREGDWIICPTKDWLIHHGPIAPVFIGHVHNFDSSSFKYWTDNNDIICSFCSEMPPKNIMAIYETLKDDNKR